MSLEGSGMVAAKENCAAKLCRSLPLMAMLWQSTLQAGGSLPELCQKILGIKELAKSLPESFLFWGSLPEICHYLWIWWLLEVISFHSVVYLEFQNLLDKDNYTLSSRPPQYWKLYSNKKKKKKKHSEMGLKKIWYINNFHHTFASFYNSWMLTT